MTGLQEVKPNSYNYNSLISAWANGEEGSVFRAEEVLDRMESLYKAGDQDVKPTTVSYNAVIDAYSKFDGHQEDDTAAGERAESILHHMQQLYESGENVDAKPNTRSYNTVINVWYVFCEAQLDSSLDYYFRLARVVLIINLSCSFLPCYNTPRSRAKSRAEQGARRVEAILELMEKLVAGGDKDVRPDSHSFSTVINGRCERAFIERVCLVLGVAALFGSEQFLTSVLYFCSLGSEYQCK